MHFQKGRDALVQRRTTGKPEPHHNHLHRLPQPFVVSSVKTLLPKALMEKTPPLFRRTGFVGLHLKPRCAGACLWRD